MDSELAAHHSSSEHAQLGSTAMAVVGGSAQGTQGDHGEPVKLRSRVSHTVERDGHDGRLHPRIILDDGKAFSPGTHH